MKRSSLKALVLAAALAVLAIVVVFVTPVTGTGAMDVLDQERDSSKEMSGKQEAVKADGVERDIAVDISQALEPPALEGSIRMVAHDYAGRPFGNEVTVLGMDSGSWHGDLRSYDQIVGAGRFIGTITPEEELVISLSVQSDTYIGLDGSGCSVQGVENSGVIVFQFPPEGVIHVSIVSEESGLPFQVQIVGPGRKYSDSKMGTEFSFPSVTFGTYEIHVKGPNVVGSAWVEHSSTSTEVEVKVREWSELLLTINDIEYGQLVENANVILHPLDASSILEPLGEGKFLVKGLDPKNKNIWLQIAAPGFADFFLLYKFPELGNHWEKSIFLDKGEAIDFRCTLEGKLIAGVDVSVHYRNMGWGYASGLQHFGVANGLTDENGRASILVPSGTKLDGASFISFNDVATWTLFASEIELEAMNEVDLVQCEPIVLSYVSNEKEAYWVSASAYLVFGGRKVISNTPVLETVTTMRSTIRLYPQPRFLLRVRGSLSGGLLYEAEIDGGVTRAIEVDLPSLEGITIGLFGMEGEPLSGTVIFIDDNTGRVVGSAPINFDGEVVVEEISVKRCRIEVSITGRSESIVVDTITPGNPKVSYQLSPNATSFFIKTK